jgi:hypothetical protein
MRRRLKRAAKHSSNLWQIDCQINLRPKEMATEKQPRGRPRHVPTQKDREIAAFASAIGTPQETIGRLIGISEQTLREHYRDELDLGMARANISVGRNLYRIATGNSPQAAPAAMFWMKTRAGWKETVRQENTGPDGGPIERVDVTAREIILAKLTQLAERELITGPVNGAQDGEPEESPPKKSIQ